MKKSLQEVTPEMLEILNQIPVRYTRPKIFAEAFKAAVNLLSEYRKNEHALRAIFDTIKIIKTYSISLSLKNFGTILEAISERPIVSDQPFLYFAKIEGVATSMHTDILDAQVEAKRLMLQENKPSAEIYAMTVYTRYQVTPDSPPIG